MNEISKDDEFTERSIRQTISLMLFDLKRAERDRVLLRERFDGRAKDHYRRLSALRERLRKNPATRYEIRRFAAECFLSPERATALYKKFFGLTPFAELVQARALLATKLLLHSNKSVAEIAELCGWENYRYFDRVFRKSAGVSPSEFRRNGAP
jgi:AraC-like DNA-binding protein